MRGAIEVEAPGPSGLWNVRVPNTQTLPTEAHGVMFALRAFWRELYDKRLVDLPGFQAVLGRHVPRVPDGAWTKVQQYSMQDLQSALDKADGKAPGPSHVEARFIMALPAPVQWLLVHSYRAILHGAPPPMRCRDRCPVSSGWSSSACTAMCGSCGTPVATSRAVPRGSPRGLGWPAPTCTITHPAWSCACLAARVHWSSVVTNHTGVGAWGRERRGWGHATSALGSSSSLSASTLWRMYMRAAGG